MLVHVLPQLPRTVELGVVHGDPGGGCGRVSQGDVAVDSSAARVDPHLVRCIGSGGGSVISRRLVYTMTITSRNTGNSHFC